MEWLESFITEEPFSIVIPIIIIVSVFAYVVRRAHIKHLERMKQIDERYIQQSASRIDN